MGCGAARRDVRGGSRRRHRRPGDVGAVRFRRVARAGPRRRAPDGRAGPRPASHAPAARLGAYHPAAPLHAHERGVGDGATPVRHAARGHGFRGVAPAHPRAAGQRPRPYRPASASKGAGQERFGRTDEMTGVGRRHGIVAAVASAIVATGLAAQQPPVVPQAPLQVTLQEAVRRALDVQPLVIQARGAVSSAGWQKRAAYGAFLPSVVLNSSAFRQNTASFVNGFLASAGTYQYNSGVTASLDLFTGFHRSGAYRNADATEDAADAGLVNQRFQATATTAQVFFTALANEELVRVSEAQVERAKAERQTAVNKFQAGAATRSDTLTATVDLGNALLSLLQAQANLATAQANLGRQVGVDQLVRAVSDSAFPPLPDTTMLRTSALQTAPLIRQAEAQVGATGAQVWSARSLYWPTVTLSYSNSRTGVSSPELPLFGNYFETFSWRFGLSWALFNGFGREQSQVAANVAHDVAVAQAADARRQVNAQYTQQLAALFTAWAQIAIAGADVAAATEAVRVQQERYRLGAGTLLDLLTAQANLTQAAVSQVQARYNYLIARAQLEAIVGHAL